MLLEMVPSFSVNHERKSSYLLVVLPSATAESFDIPIRATLLRAKKASAVGSDTARAAAMKISSRVMSN